jgi:hypothetical protein
VDELAAVVGDPVPDERVVGIGPGRCQVTSAGRDEVIFAMPGM